MTCSICRVIYQIKGGTAGRPRARRTASSTRAQNAVSVKRNATATFKFKVSDVQSTKTTVTIKIKKGSTTKKTFSLGSKSVNTSLSYKVKITLPKGKYTWFVYAKDQAGNAQASPAGKNTLTVK